MVFVILLIILSSFHQSDVFLGCFFFSSNSVYVRQQYWFRKSPSCSATQYLMSFESLTLTLSIPWQLRVLIFLSQMEFLISPGFQALPEYQCLDISSYIFISHLAVRAVPSSIVVLFSKSVSSGSSWLDRIFFFARLAEKSQSHPLELFAEFLLFRFPFVLRRKGKRWKLVLLPTHIFYKNCHIIQASLHYWPVMKFYLQVWEHRIYSLRNSCHFIWEEHSYECKSTHSFSFFKKARIEQS